MTPVQPVVTGSHRCYAKKVKMQGI